MYIPRFLPGTLCQIRIQNPFIFLSRPAWAGCADNFADVIDIHGSQSIVGKLSLKVSP
jgi:hypothetical protein